MISDRSTTSPQYGTTQLSTPITPGYRHRYLSRINIVLVYACILSFLTLNVFSDVNEKFKQDGGVFASGSRAQLVAAFRHAIEIADEPSGTIRDLVVSPDNERVYAIDSAGYLSVYKASDTTTLPHFSQIDSVPIMDFNHPGSPLKSMESLAITPDARIAFIAASSAIMMVNLTKTTLIDPDSDSPVVYQPYEYQQVISQESGNYVEVKMGPSGRYLYYVIDNSKRVPSPYDDATVFGKIGAYEINLSLANPGSDSAIRRAWERDIVRLRGDPTLSAAIERGGSDAFIGPYSLTISPDEDYALLSARGVAADGGYFDPVLGWLPPRDETTGGILIIDLQENASANTPHGDYLGYRPTLVRGEKNLMARLASYAQTVENPQVTALTAAAGNAGAGAGLLSSASGGVGSAVALRETNLAQKAQQEFARVFANYGLLAGYRSSYPNDMVGIREIGIVPSGNLGLAAMQWTNNIGILKLGISIERDGFNVVNRPDRQIYLWGATEKSVSTGIDSLSSASAEVAASQELWPEEVAVSASGNTAYVGMRGGRQANGQKFGYMELPKLHTELISRTDADLAATAIVAAGLFLGPVSSTEGDIHFPRETATFHQDNVDADLLSDHVEAYNRFNHRLGIEREVIGLTPASVTSPAVFNADRRIGILLPPEGLGYRLRERNGPDRTNAGIAALVNTIEMVGREWHRRHLTDEANYSGHAYFVINQMSAPGWKNSVDDTGLISYAETRYGNLVDIQYFAAVDGSDTPFDFVQSNNTDPLNNSMLADISGFDRIATHALIDLFLRQPAVVEIRLDPGVGYASTDTRVKIRGDADYLNPGSRRDLDAFFQVRVQDIVLDLVGYENGIAVSEGRETGSGNGIRYQPENTVITIVGPLSGEENLNYRLSFSASSLSLVPIDGGAALQPGDPVQPGEKYQVVAFTDPSGAADIQLQVVDVGSGDVVFQDTITVVNDRPAIFSPVAAVVPLNSVDKDGDHIVDFADGFDGDQSTIADNLNTREKFTELILTIPSTVTFTDAAMARFFYSASDPNQLDGENGIYTFQPGYLRLWKKPGNVARNRQSIEAGGDYIPPEAFIKLQDLGFSPSQSTVTLYLEGIRASRYPQDQEIKIIINPDPALYTLFPIEDSVMITVLDQIPSRFRPDCTFYRVDQWGVPIAEIPLEVIPEVDRPESGFFVDMYTLHPYWSQADISIPLPDGETRLEFRRGSGVVAFDNNGVTDYSRAGEYNLMGRAWRSNIEVHAFAYDDVISIFGEDGKLYRFNYAGDPQPHSFLDASTNHGSLALVTTATGIQSIIWHCRFGTEYHFETSGVPFYYRLREVVSRNHNRIVYDYDSESGPDSLFPSQISFDDPAIAAAAKPVKITMQYTSLTVAGLAVKRLTSVTDPRGAVFNFNYDSAGELIRVIYPAVPVVSAPDSALPATTTTNPEVTYAYETKSYPNRFAATAVWQALKSITDARSNTSSFAYSWQTMDTAVDDDASRAIALSTIMLPESDLKTQFACTRNYPENQPVIECLVTTPNQTRWQWNFRVAATSSYLPWEIAGEHFTDIFLLECRREVFKNTTLGSDVAMTPESQLWTFSWSGDRWHNLLEWETPDGIVNRYDYGSLTTFCLHDYPYARFQRPAHFVRDLNGLSQTFQFCYDLNFNKIIAIGEPLAVAAAVPDPAYRIAITLDDRGNPIMTGRGEITIMERQFDDLGVIIAERDGDGRYATLTRAADASGSTYSKTRYAGYSPTIDAVPSTGLTITETLVYDLNGNLVTRTDGRGFSTAFTYDALNMLLRRTDPAVLPYSDISIASVVPSSALNPVTEYFYDANRNRVAVKNPRGHYTLFAFDTMNRSIQSIIAIESGTSVSLVGPSLNITTLTAYDAAGNIASRTDGNGNVTTFYYDELNRPSKIVSPAVDVTTVDSTDNVASFTISPTIYHRYDQHSGDAVLISDRWRPSKTVDARRFVTVNTYDSLYRLTANRRYATALSSPPHEVPITTDADILTTYSDYDLNGNLGKTTLMNVVDGIREDRITITEYDTFNRPIRNRRPLSASGAFIETFIAYDVMGNTVKTAGPNPAQSTQNEYDGLARLIKTVVNLDGDAAIKSVDNNRFVIDHVADDSDQVTRYVYDANSNRISSIIENTGGNQETRYEYDALDRPTKVIDPAGALTTTGYDLNGNVVATIDADNFATVYEYDAANRRTQTHYPNGFSTSVVYDKNSNVVSSIDRRGTRTVTNYNALNRPTTTTLEAESNVVTTHKYDEAGNLTVMIDRRDQETHSTYDFANRVVLTTTPPQSTATVERPRIQREYDNAGNLLTLTGNVIPEFSRYDLADRRVLHKTGDDNDPAQQHINYEYYLATNVVRQIVKNDAASGGDQITDYTYDAADRLVREELPDGGSGRPVTAYTYDRVGNIFTVTDARGQTITYSYSTDNTLAAQTYEGREEFNKTFAWDQRKNLVEAIDNSGTLTYRYNEMGWLADETRHDSANRLISKTAYVYDANGNRTGVTYDDGDTIVYENDRENRRTQITHAGRDISYAYQNNSKANTVTITQPNGEKTVRHFNPLGILEKVETNNSQGDNVYTVTYALNALGQRTGTNETWGVGGESGYRIKTTGYTYDTAGRLIGDSTPDGQAIAYTYDRAGNRTRKTVGGQTWTYTINALNQVTQVSTPGGDTVVYTYDPNGNLILRSQRGTGVSPVISSLTYTWDPDNRLISVSQISNFQSVIFSTSYDHQNRRVSKTENTASVYYAYDNMEVSRELDADLTIYKDFIRNTFEGTPGELSIVANRSDGDYRTFAYNATGTVMSITISETSGNEPDTTSTINATSTAENPPETVTTTSQSLNVEYVDAWGGLASSDVLSQHNRLWHSKEFDTSTGLYYFGYRYYDPVLGRFINRDLTGFPDGPNNYLFANNNPVNKIDKLGDALYAFDGTWNDMNNVPKGERRTNVAELRELYTTPNKAYIPGVGTDPWYSLFKSSKFIGGAFGLGGKGKLKEMYKRFDEFYNSMGDKEVIIIGFSRGAAMARDFANMITQKAIKSGQAPPIIQFVGVFDTVGSFGLGGNFIDFGYDFDLPANVERAAHAVAGNEKRRFFSLAAFKDSPKVASKEFIGAAHADVGAGYLENGLSNAALYWMWKQMRDAGINTFRAPSTEVHDDYMMYETYGEALFRSGTMVGHDSRWLIDKIFPLKERKVKQFKVE